ncbi:MAG: PAS domain S-box protein, partial [Syntrophales bacterium]|nr:PAS domain S-box protein [Syntrophales bacterium]
FSTLPDVYIRLRADGKIVDFKGPAADDPHFLVPSPQGMFLGDIVPPAIREVLESFLRRILNTGTMATVEYCIETPTGAHHYEARGVPFQQDQAVVIIRDVTQQRRIMETLQREAQEKAIILDSMSEIVIFIDRDFRIVWANRAMRDFFPLDEAFYTGKPCFQVLHDRSRPCEVCPAVKTMETGEAQIHPDHSSYGRRWVLRSYPVRHPSGEVIGVVQIITDVTQSRRAEDALRKSEERYRRVVENATLSITVVKDWHFVYVNPRVMEVTGYTYDELMAIPIPKIVHPDDLPMIADIHQRLLRGEEVPPTYTARIIHKDGSLLWGEFSGVLIPWEGEQATMVFIRNVTVEKQLEEQLLLAQKREAVGTLAGGIAHDFNNILMGIQGYISLILLDLPPHHAHYERIKNIEKLVQSGANLTKQLLGFARGGKYDVKTTDLNEFIAHNLELFSRTHRDIATHTHLEEGLWPVEVDRSQIEQVLLNLFINAWQAMPGGGDLYVETHNCQLDKVHTAAYQLPPGRYVRVSIRDTGIGMDENTRRRVFDPFFTTKGMGRGTGLGLASAYGIIANHGGTITVESEEGKGSVFHILLPAAQKKPHQEREEAHPTPAIPWGKKETILIVDDEKNNIDVIGAMLGKIGYRTVGATSGQEAVDYYRQHCQAVDLVLLDATMPGMSGSKTLEALKEINPQVRVILASGHNIQEIARSVTDPSVRAYIQKPFRIQDLANKVREALAAAPSQGITCLLYTS